MTNKSAENFRTKGIYVAVLNQGWIRTELVQLLVDLTHQGKYRLFLSYPSQKPISYNRNLAVKNFLDKPEYDYLLFLDGDIVPPLNILDLALYDKDIIGGVCFGYLRAENFGYGIVPFVMRQNEKGTYDVMNLDGTEGLVECDGIGSGCMLIKREVLEKMKYPFKNIYDEDGIKLRGLDFNFCTESKKKGFKVWAHLNYPCGHYTDMDLATIYRAMTESEEIVKSERKIKAQKLTT